MRSTGDAPTVGRRVLVVEDGPTLTHGEMKFGAGVVAAERAGAKEIVDPRPYVTGTLKAVFDKYDVGPVLPAEGYSPGQLAELEAAIAATDCEVVVVATPDRPAAPDPHPAARGPGHVLAAGAAGGPHAEGHRCAGALGRRRVTDAGRDTRAGGTHPPLGVSTEGPGPAGKGTLDPWPGSPRDRCLLT